MSKIISVGKKKINELLELPMFKGRTQSWAYNVLAGHSQTEQAEEFRSYVLKNCHGTIITKKKF